MMPSNTRRQPARGHPVEHGGASSSKTSSIRYHRSSVIAQITGSTPVFRFFERCAILDSPQPFAAAEVV